MKKTVRDIAWAGKTAVMRCDFNVPLADGVITDDTRIKAALPTIEYLIGEGASIVIMSHLGRPKGKPVKEMSLEPVAKRLSEYIGKDVIFCPSDAVVDEEVKKAAGSLEAGSVMLIENVRYRAEETDFRARIFDKENMVVLAKMMRSIDGLHHK